jgi:hypothetical protein
MMMMAGWLKGRGQVLQMCVNIEKLLYEDGRQQDQNITTSPHKHLKESLASQV